MCGGGYADYNDDVRQAALEMIQEATAMKEPVGVLTVSRVRCRHLQSSSLFVSLCATVVFRCVGVRMRAC